MGSLTERLAKQALGSICVSQRWQEEIDGSTRGIDGPIQVAPTTLHPNADLVYPPRLVCRLAIPSQSLLQLGAVILHPAPDGCVIDVETTLLQFLNIAQRKRIAKIPPDRTKYEIRFGLSPFEDPGSGLSFRDSFTSPTSTRKSQHIPCEHYALQFHDGCPFCFKFDELLNVENKWDRLCVGAAAGTRMVSEPVS
jgi:hypothetical protein